MSSRASDVIPSTRRPNARNGTRERTYGRAARTSRSRSREWSGGSKGSVATAMMLLAGLGGNDLRDLPRPGSEGVARLDAAAELGARLPPPHGRGRMCLSRRG